MITSVFCVPINTERNQFMDTLRMIKYKSAENLTLIAFKTHLKLKYALSLCMGSLKCDLRSPHSSSKYFQNAA